METITDTRIPKYSAELNFIVNKVALHQSHKELNSFQIPVGAKKSNEYAVEFSGGSHSYCIGFVDMVNSTKISAALRDEEWCEYYGLFINSLSRILRPFGGEVIKNVGDSLLYYFPDASNARPNSFASCIEAGIVMIEARDAINEVFCKEHLPSVCYRVSSDYGKVVAMKSNKSSCIDLIGPPVNMCVKINHNAEKNQMVIGGDLYQMVKDLKDYEYGFANDFSLGFKQAYPVYTVRRKNQYKSIYQ